MSILSHPHFFSEKAAIAQLEAIVWPNGPVCPKCGNGESARFTKHQGATARLGLRTCLECKKQFTVKVGTVLESSHVPLHKWFQAAHLMASSQKAISAYQLHRTLQVTYKTAWSMEHRLRDAMRELFLDAVDDNSGIDDSIDADGTVIAREPGKLKRCGDYPYNNRPSPSICGVERFGNALTGVASKRLTYQGTLTAKVSARDSVATNEQR